LAFPKSAESIVVQGVTEKPYDVLRQLARKAGLLAIAERLRYGKKLAARRGVDFTWEHFIEAHLTIEQAAQSTEEWA
jgi:hypothetical protein